MTFDIEQLQKIRKQLNLTQHQFAKEAGISQSMVAKIESGKLDPSYSNVKRIEQTLNLMLKQEQKQAKDIMTSTVISVNPHEKISKVIEIMQKKSLSQIPVIEKKKLIGMITESSILAKVDKETAHEVMDELPPTIALDTPVEVIQQLLKYYSCILIKEHGNLVGIITRADLVKSLVNK